MGTIYYRLEQYKQARSAFSQVIQGKDFKNDDLSLAAALRLAETLYLEFDPHEFDTARDQFEQISMSLQGETLKPLQKQVAALAACGQAVIWAHWLYTDPKDQNRLNQVVENCQRAIDLAGNSNDVKAACSIALGIANFNQGDAAEALQEFNRAVQTKRDYPSALIYLARTLVWMVGGEKNPEALDKKVLEGENLADKAPARKAELLRELEERAAQAITLLEESINKGLPGRQYAQKELAELYTCLGRIHAKTGNLDQALLDYQRAVEIDPKMADAWDNMAYRTIGAGRTDSETLSKCEMTSRKAVALGVGTPQEASYRATLADVLCCQERYTEAMQEIELACALPTNNKVRQRIANIRKKIQAQLDSK